MSLCIEKTASCLRKSSGVDTNRYRSNLGKIQSCKLKNLKSSHWKLSSQHIQLGPLDCLALIALAQTSPVLGAEFVMLKLSNVYSMTLSKAEEKKCAVHFSWSFCAWMAL